MCNGTQGFWDLCSNQYPGGVVPGTWGALGAALYGPWIGGAVNYGTAISIPTSTLPLKKDIAVITANLLYDDNTGKEKIENIKKFWVDHTRAIEKFRRYPHRNKILGRQSTDEEIKFLNGPNSSW